MTKKHFIILLNAIMLALRFVGPVKGLTLSLVAPLSLRLAVCGLPIDK